MSVPPHSDDDINSIQSGHVHVDEDAREGRSRKLVQEGFAGREFDRIEGQRCNHPAQRAANDFIIIHYGYPRFYALHHAVLQHVPLTGNWPSVQYGSVICHDGQSDKVRDGANAHLLHHAAAMDLDGFLDSAEFGRNLLVQAPGNHA